MNRPILEGLQGVLHIADDIIAYSANQQDHDIAFEIAAIKSNKQPTNVAELRLFLEMTNYVSRFIPN